MGRERRGEVGGYSGFEEEGLRDMETWLKRSPGI